MGAEGLFPVNLNGLAVGGEDPESAALMNLKVEGGDVCSWQDQVVPGIGANEEAALAKDLWRVSLVVCGDGNHPVVGRGR
jgi:hypothetical protein